ncbi:kielin/chordin-like protein [Fopius arisanus]|uniref:Kielin/chordin-like protein n=1 Tax=Fopius arisanus TaxID=64838 RepID=A0A0C9RKT5_9HYME|nr:PREDICTED: kielin/chordin-like protein [Fopius arisanus]
MKSTIIIVLALCICWTAARSPPKPGCENDCPGPLKFYKELGCKPVMMNEGDCCAQRYDCDHLATRSKDKCHAFGREYNPSEELREEDKSCLGECTCIKPGEDDPTWACATVELQVPSAAGCYRPQNASMCFPGPEVCPPNADDIAKCEVDGNTLNDGDYFEPAADPFKACWCGPGWKGEYEAPFCKDMREQKCGMELHDMTELENNCAPIWSVGQDPRHECPRMWRCQKDDDVVTPREKDMGTPETETPEPEGMTCKLGNLSMRRGDSVDQRSTETLDCIKCICDIPPMATCLRLPKDSCYLTAEEMADSHEKA